MQKITAVRREALIRSFELARPRWLSLDVFDTLLTRAFRTPTDVFIDAHRSLACLEGCPPSPLAFARMRVEAEAAARRAHPSGEVCFEDVCAELSRAMGGRPDAATLAEHELRAERQCVRLDADIAALVVHASEQRVPYILVSDMYLRAQHLLDLLRAAAGRAGLDLPEPAGVFVSGERRANKAGTLFDLILKSLGCAPSELLHIGDHPAADVESPRRRGIPAVHYFRETPYLRQVFSAEDQWLSRISPGLEAYDFGLRRTRSSALTSAQASAEEQLDHLHYGAFVLGPVLAAFAEWVATECDSQRRRTAYCLMREGHLLAPLITRAAQALSVDLDVRTLWVSRYALRGASFRTASRDELEPYFDKRSPVTLGQAAGDLGVDAGLLLRESGVHHGEGLGGADRERVVHALTGHPELRAQMLATAVAKRRRLLAYLDRVGALEQEGLLVVDLGWGGSLQKMLAHILGPMPRPRRIDALYLATHERVGELPADSCSAQSFLFHSGQPRATCTPLQRSPEILEHACMAPQGSLRDFNEHGASVHFPQLVPPQQIRQIAELQAGVMHYAELWFAGAAERRALMSHVERQCLLERLRATVARSLDNPLGEEVQLFEAWLHDANDGSELAEPLLGASELRREARFMILDDLLKLSWHDCYWPQGLAVSLGKSKPSWSRKLPAAWRRSFARGASMLYARGRHG